MDGFFSDKKVVLKYLLEILGKYSPKRKTIYTNFQKFQALSGTYAEIRSIERSEELPYFSALAIDTQFTVPIQFISFSSYEKMITFLFADSM